MNDPVLTGRTGPVCEITLNRPGSLNALNRPLLSALKEALAAAHADTDTSVIVLRGAGSAFCAGKDLKEHGSTAGDRDALREEIATLQDISRGILFGDKLVIAGVHGWAAGGGLELAIASDLLVLSEDATVFFPEMSLGLFVTCGVSAILPRMIGLAQSRALMFTGDRLSAPRAMELGMAWKLVAANEFDDRLMEAALALAAMPRRSQQQLKRVMAAGMREEIEAALALEARMAEATALDAGTQHLIEENFLQRRKTTG